MWGEVAGVAACKGADFAEMAGGSSGKDGLPGDDAIGLCDSGLLLLAGVVLPESQSQTQDHDGHKRCSCRNNIPLSDWQLRLLVCCCSDCDGWHVQRPSGSPCACLSLFEGHKR